MQVDCWRLQLFAHVRHPLLQIAATAARRGLLDLNQTGRRTPSSFPVAAKQPWPRPSARRPTTGVRENAASNRTPDTQARRSDDRPRSNRIRPHQSLSHSEEQEVNAYRLKRITSWYRKGFTPDSLTKPCLSGAKPPFLTMRFSELNDPRLK